MKGTGKEIWTKWVNAWTLSERDNVLKIYEGKEKKKESPYIYGFLTYYLCNRKEKEKKRYVS